MAATQDVAKQATNAHQQLTDMLSKRFGSERVLTDRDLCLAHGTDASFYRLIPKLIVKLDNIDEVVLTMQLCRKLKVPYTFRAAGTSLSGQAISDSVLITLTDNWRSHTILQYGAKIQLQPGVIGADANRYLAEYGRKIGPDPASINSCKIGGIAANNASGMCCGTAQNSYNTVAAMTMVLYDGTVLNTADEQSVQRFRRSHFDLLESLKELHQTVHANQQLKAKIEHKYRLKNTTGYALNALLDFHDPIDILVHLMIGSEGTLGFIADITYHTVVDSQFKASSLVVFENNQQACLAVTALAKCDVAAVELMDGRAMQSVVGAPNMPEFLATLTHSHCALLIEVHADSQEQLETYCSEASQQWQADAVVSKIDFTQDPTQVAALWAMRKGMFPAVGAVREVGTTVIIEDVAFPVEQLAAGVDALQRLFEEFHYTEAIIFGHALEGNLHFVFTQGFEQVAEVTRYAEFMQRVAHLVGKEFGGSLKAEHGTGRNMAPFVELEWGHDAYQLMQQVKAILDPERLLNPGVILTDNPNSHLENLKPLPKADAIVDKCIECGFCEPVCPSKGLTLTPRQRIVLYREIERRKRNNEPSAQLEQTYQYQGIDTCAATGLCADRCPVNINTGQLIKQLRSDRNQRFEPIAKWSAKHFSATSKLVKSSLVVNGIAAHLVGEKSMSKAVNGLRKLSKQRSPQWLKEMPMSANKQWQVQPPAPQYPHQILRVNKVVYFPSCASRTMGQSPQATDRRPLPEVMQSILAKAGFSTIVPPSLTDLCCGMPFESKGLNQVAEQKSNQLEQALWQASEHGKYPIVMDTSPCTKRMLENSPYKLEILEPMQFVQQYLIDNLEITPLPEPIMLHITCSTKRMGLSSAMLEVAKRCSTQVVIPEHIECCGWAGDKGFTTPELNANALKPLKSQVPDNCTRGYSNSRSCEIGLSHHSGINYQSLLYLVDEVSQAASPQP